MSFRANRFPVRRWCFVSHARAQLFWFESTAQSVFVAVTCVFAILEFFIDRVGERIVVSWHR